MSDELWVRQFDVASHFGVSTATVLRWRKAGMPYYQRFQHSWPLFKVSECERWHAAGRPGLAGQATSQAAIEQAELRQRVVALEARVASLEDTARRITAAARSVSGLE